MYNLIEIYLLLFYAINIWRLGKVWGEQTTLEPTLNVYNVVNKANFDPPGGFITAPLSGVLGGAPGEANGTIYSARINRYGLGTGVFSQGAPRSLEIGARLTF